MIDSFTPDQSWSLIVLFTDALWDNRHKNYRVDEEILANYCGDLISDPASDSDWRKSYHKVFGYNLRKSDHLNAAQVFTTMIEMCALYVFQFGDDSSILHLFYDMKYKPDNYQPEWNLWNQCIKKVKEGELPQRVDFADATGSNGVTTVQRGLAIGHLNKPDFTAV